MIAGASRQQLINDQTGSKAVEDVDLEMVKCQERLETLKEYQRFLHSDEPAIRSESELDERDRKLMGFLSKVMERKSSLLNMLTPLSGPITQMQLEEQQNVLMPENRGLVQPQPHEDLTLSAWQMQLQEQQNSLLPENSGLVQAQPHEELTWNGFQMRLQEQQSKVLVENSGLVQAEPHEESTWNDLRMQSQVQNNLVVEGSGLVQTQPHEEGTFLTAPPGTVSLDSVNCEMPMPSEIDRIFDLWDAVIDPSLVQELLDCFSN